MRKISTVTNSFRLHIPHIWEVRIAFRRSTTPRCYWATIMTTPSYILLLFRFLTVPAAAAPFLRKLLSHSIVLLWYFTCYQVTYILSLFQRRTVAGCFVVVVLISSLKFGVRSSSRLIIVVLLFITHNKPVIVVVVAIIFWTTTSLYKSFNFTVVWSQKLKKRDNHIVIEYCCCCCYYCFIPFSFKKDNNLDKD